MKLAFRKNAVSGRIFATILGILLSASGCKYLEQLTSAPLHPCDDFAAHPDDEQRRSGIAGVSDDAIKAEMAIEACVEALKQYTNTPRFYFQLGRALLLGGKPDDAEPFLLSAASADYAAALTYLGDLQEDLADARELYDLSRDRGFRPAVMRLKELEEVQATIRRCDDLAAHPADSERPEGIPGVDDMNLKAEVAIDGCLAALEIAPSLSRLSFQLGRSLLAVGMVDEAQGAFKKAADGKYAAALAYLADTEQDQTKALALYKESAAGGFKPAELVLAEAKAAAENEAREAARGNVPSQFVGYAEPSEREMRVAMERAMLEQGGTRRGPGEIGAGTSLSGVSMTLMSFEKLGCEPADDSQGYFCSYKFRAKIRAFTNERSAEAQRHNEAANTVLKLFQGGQDEQVGTATRRFMKQRDNWVVLMQ